LPVQRQVIIGKIQPAYQFSYYWHDDVLHQGIDNFCECCADDYTDCQIHDIAAGNKAFEFLHHAHAVLLVVIVKTNLILAMCHINCNAILFRL